MGQRVRRHRHDLIAAAAQGIQNLHVFGSVVRDEDRPDSDVDLLAHLPRPDLEAILGTWVELIHAVDL